MTLYPWKYGNTSEEIASQVESQWETPGGAQEKADKAEENAKEYADETFAKNAFSKVASPGRSTVNADDKEDTLTIEAGTGIAITTDPIQKKVTFWTQGDSAPGAHGETHNNDGSDPIPDLQEVTQDLATHLDDYEQNAIKRDGSVAMSGDLEIDKNTPYINLEHNSSGTSINGGILARNKEQDIWRVGRSSGNGVFIIDAFVNAIDFRSAISRYFFRGPSDSVATIAVHDGHPEGSVGGNIGSLCLRTDGGSHGKLYVKTSGTGNTGWVEVQTV